MGTWTLGADNATVRNVPEPGPGPIQAAPADSAVEPHQRHPLRRQVDLPRRDVQGRAPAAPTTSPTTSATRCRTRRTMPRVPGATESEANVPQNVRNIFDETGEWALSSFDHRHQFIASGVYQLPFFSGAGGVAEGACSAAGASTPSSSRSRARRSRSTSASIAPTSAPARRSGPTSCAIPTCRAASGRRSAGSTPSAFALQAPFTFGSAPRNSVIGPGLRQRRFRAGQDLARSRGTLAARVPLGGLQPASTAPTSICRTASSATRTSAASSAPRIRARCSSASGSPSSRSPRPASAGPSPSARSSHRPAKPAVAGPVQLTPRMPMSGNILLVEDESALRMTLGDRLRKEGYVVDSPSDGEEGLNKATQLPFDLIVLDVMLPRLDGFAVCSGISRGGPDHTGADADRARPHRREGQRPQDRRRRLRHQAVPDAGAARARRRAAAARAGAGPTPG